VSINVFSSISAVGRMQMDPSDSLMDLCIPNKVTYLRFLSLYYLTSFAWAPVFWMVSLVSVHNAHSGDIALLIPQAPREPCPYQ
jgi:hypothetical protein